jgi:TetR/AcrR family transcriptional repressor of nem operon
MAMARPREFDVDEALQRALEVFWQQGFAATSMQDLVAAMGIQKASLYATFGDKHTLYTTALRRYQQETLDELTEHLAKAASPLTAITEFVDEVVEHTARDGRRGCLCVNANTELAPHDAEVAELLRAHHERMESLLAATIERARTLGEIPHQADPRALATFLLGVVVAMNVLGKQRASRRQLQALRDHGLAALRR